MPIPRAQLFFLLLSLPVAAPAQPLFERLEGVAAPTATLVCTECDGSILESDGERLVRLRAGTRKVIATVEKEGTGAIHDLALDPAGAVFVAAERGLFIVSPEVDVLDRVELKDGAPPGHPRAARVDARRRLWLATDEAFGVVDTVWFFGRTFGVAEGVPAGPFTALALSTEGALVLAAAGGTYRYVPDRGPLPAVQVVSVDGAPPAAEGVARATWPARPAVTLEGRAGGGPTYRFAPEGHHRWRPFTSGERVPESLAPGLRRLSFVAYDRDLRRSAPVALRVRVAYPFFLRKLFLLSAGAGLALLVLALFLLAARRGGGGRVRYGRAALSAALLLWLALEVAAALFPHARGWPFVGYTMYCTHFDENGIVSSVEMQRVTPEGRRVWVSTADFGQTVDSAWFIIRPFLNGGEARRRAFLERYLELHGKGSARGLQVVAVRRRLTADGPVRVAPLVMARVSVEGADGS